jgi:hypothetical protein
MSGFFSAVLSYVSRDLEMEVNVKVKLSLCF